MWIEALLVFASLLLAAPAAAETGTLAELLGTSTLSRVRSKNTLRVGMHAGIVPFVAAGPDAEELRKLVGEKAPPLRSTTDGKNVAGLDVELVAEAARALGVQLEIVMVERFDDLLPGLRAGKYDLAAAAITRTLERAVHVAFSDPYFTSGLEVMVKEADAARFATLESLKKAEIKVAVKAGTTGESFARERLAGAQLLSLASETALLQAVAEGRAQAAVVDHLGARDALVRGQVKAALVPIENRRFTVEHFALAARRGDTDWLDWINLFLRDVKSRGTFHRLAARYGAWFRIER